MLVLEINAFEIWTFFETKNKKKKQPVFENLKVIRHSVNNKWKFLKIEIIHF